MADQLNIAFPNYTFDMDKVRVAMLLAELEAKNKKLLIELEAKNKKIQHLEYTIRTYKGHFTKQNKKSNGK